MSASGNRDRNWQRKAGRVPGATRYELLVASNPFRRGWHPDGSPSEWRYSRWPMLVEYDNQPNNIRTVSHLTDGKASSAFFAACNARGLLRLHVDDGAPEYAWAQQATLQKLSDELRAELYFSLDSVVDERERRLREVVQRRGQPEFRRALLLAYDGQCCVTSCDAEPALEAAHIVAYSGPSSNHVTNGLLLRADVHTLFDLDLVAVNPVSLKLRVASELLDSCYREINGVMVRLPRSEVQRPNLEALQQRWCQFQRIRGE